MWQFNFYQFSVLFPEVTLKFNERSPVVYFFPLKLKPPCLNRLHLPIYQFVLSPSIDPHICIYTWKLLVFLLKLTSSFISLYQRYVWFQSFYMLRFVLWPNIWSVLENVAWVLEKIVYPVFGYSALHMSVRSSWFTFLFRFSVSLLSFCVDVLSITENGKLKFSTNFVELCVSPFNSINVCFIYFHVLLLGAYMLIIIISSWLIDPCINI